MCSWRSIPRAACSRRTWRRRASPEAQELRARLAPDGEVLLGYVGRVAPEKSLDRLGALRGIPGIRIVIVGDGPARPGLERSLAGLPITFLGALGGERLANAYASFDAFVHTGTEETFGQTVQEAHASGLPVVAPRAGGPIDLVEHGVDGLLFPPADDRGLRAAVSMLTDDAPLRLRMGEAGRRRVLGRGWDVLCAELVGHYEQVILDACTDVRGGGVQRPGRLRAYS